MGAPPPNSAPRGRHTGVCTFNGSVTAKAKRVGRARGLSGPRRGTQLVPLALPGPWGAAGGMQAAGTDAGAALARSSAAPLCPACPGSSARGGGQQSRGVPACVGTGRCGRGAAGWLGRTGSCPCPQRRQCQPSALQQPPACGGSAAASPAPMGGRDPPCNAGGDRSCSAGETSCGSAQRRAG